MVPKLTGCVGAVQGRSLDFIGGYVRPKKELLAVMVVQGDGIVLSFDYQGVRGGAQRHLNKNSRLNSLIAQLDKSTNVSPMIKKLMYFSVKRVFHQN